MKQEHVDWCIKSLSKDVVKLMKNYPIWLGGGYIRSRITGEEPSDIDLFGDDIDSICWAAYNFVECRMTRGIKVTVFKTKNAITIKSPGRLPVQFIKRWVGPPTYMMESFDFTICQAMIWWDGAEFQARNHLDFYADLASRSLVYTLPDRNEDAGGSMLRVIKFCRRGWKISPENLSEVIARLAGGIDWEKHMTENEESLALVINGLLRDVDPLL